ncbi:ABC transporter permease [Marinomonas mediterranea]|uniref:ABC-type transporter, integral membrane subunit n=1 Tax=Marinomonas mediterranea (strain ATCC 700492 / JCM 21426 / NBRC 103028 / MMB-1) TaxID=717774 RepID=F2K0M5_MARM1|nr:ABC transporter permease [Marinomonas mediterranea]ADZ91009.1 ABC-type transporter, integral membrane subunit [Marinomonas mediterranea MMB-1]WCN09046.1 ABC transporter permease [Marinomonas mediterranea]WCN13078.1 ABC transporter permease [Marinomonas mediterranea]WCN17148.1 ABC transporter permease [Marinomonas mediterranea MMB-1]
MIQVQARTDSSTLMQFASPILAILLTLIFGSILFVALDKDPLQALHVLLIMPLSDAYNVGEMLVKMGPLLLCAVGLSLCYRANLWNIGAEGQLLAGALGGSAVGLMFVDSDSSLALPITLVAGILSGMFWAALPTYLKIKFNSNLILTTIMFNYIGLYLLVWAVHGPLRDPDGFGFPESAMFSDATLLPTLVESGRAHWGVIAAILSGIVAWLIMSRTHLGFQIRVFGSDAPAAKYAGFSSNKITWFVMLFAGALAGLAGVSEVIGPIGQLVPVVSPGYGYAAIIVAYLGRLHPIGAIAASIFLAVLYMGGDLAQIEMSIPTAVVGMFQGILLFFLLACDFFIRYRIVLSKDANA